MLQLGANGVQAAHRLPRSAPLSAGSLSANPKPPISAPPVADGADFLLYDSLADTKKFVMQNSLPYLLLFTESVRGLNHDAPVEFRGVRIGTVNGVSFTYLPNDPERRVPVLIQIDPDAHHRPAAGQHGAGREIHRATRSRTDCAPVSRPAIT